MSSEFLRSKGPEEQRNRGTKALRAQAYKSVGINRRICPARLLSNAPTSYALCALFSLTGWGMGFAVIIDSAQLPADSPQANVRRATTCDIDSAKGGSLIFDRGGRLG